MQTARLRSALLVGLGALSFTAVSCSGGLGLSFGEQVADTGRSVANLLPTADIFDTLPDLGGGSTLVHALGGVEMSEMAQGMRATAWSLGMTKEIWCALRGLMRADGVEISLAEITDTRFTGGTLQTIRFQREFDGTHDEGCSGDHDPPTVPFFVRVDLALWDSNGNPVELRQRNADARVRDVMGLVQFASTAQGFDPDTAVGEHVGFAFVSGLPSSLSMEFQDSEFPQLPADGAGLGSMTFVVDLERLPDDSGNTTQGEGDPKAIMIAVNRVQGGSEVLASARIDDPLNTSVRMFDARFQTATGMIMGVLFPEPQTAAVVGTPPSFRTLVGFMSLAEGNRGAGFALDPYSPTNLAEAWNEQGERISTEGYVVPTQFPGWPGASEFWTDAFCHGVCQDWIDVLDALPAVTTWYPATSGN
ncbi:MAG: hypothetical protein AB7I19_14985 [Planctomycetota bacterium]